MRKKLLIALVIFLGVGIFAAAYAEGVKKDDVLFARYGLRGDGNTIYFHNMKRSPIIIPIGTEVKVISVSKEKIVVQRVDNSKQYKVLAFSDFWDKFFVRNRNEIGLESVSADKRTVVDNNQVVEGMTKQEVYLSKGCPAYIGYGVKSNIHPLEEVMKSDIWYYNSNSRMKDAVITFENGHVTGMVDRATKVKQKMDAIKEKNEKK